MSPDYDKDSKTDLKVSTEDFLLKLRFDYAWKWFEYHAAQRITMFNYFLVITGILGNAYVVLLKEGLFAIAAGLASLGTLTTVGFFCLDWRNKQLVDMGEDVLEKLERDDIFTGLFKMENGQELVQLGFRVRELQEEPRWKENRIRWLETNIVKHKVWIRTIEVAVGLCFATATVIPLGFPNMIQTRSGTQIIQLQGQIDALEAFVKGALVSSSSTSAPVQPQGDGKREKSNDGQVARKP